jgi:hypothetical protein
MGEACLCSFRRQHMLMMITPGIERAGGGRLHPSDGAAGRAKGAGQPVDVRHDVAGGRNLQREAFGDEVVLHIDDDQRGARGIDRIMTRQPALTPYDAVLDLGGNRIGMHKDLRQGWKFSRGYGGRRQASNGGSSLVRPTATVIMLN